MQFDSVTIMAIMRHILTFGGGIMVSLGWIDEATVTALAGALATVAGLVWSIWDKKALPKE